MRITIKRQNGILTIPQEYIRLQGITPDGRYHYIVRYTVDVQRAVKSQSILVKIHASLDSPDIRATSGFSQLNSDQVIQNLLVSQTEKIEANRSFTAGFIATVTSDISAKIPNDKTQELTSKGKLNTGNQKNYENGKLTQEKFLFEKKNLRLAKVADLTAKNVSQATFQTPLFQPEITQIAPVVGPQENAYRLILDHGIDPSVIGAPTYQFSPADKALGGITRLPGGIIRDAIVSAPVGATQSSFGLLYSIIGDQASKPATQLGAGKNDYTHVVQLERTNKLTIEEDLFLNVSDVGDQFYLVYVLQNTAGVEQETISAVVQHTRNLAIHTIPTKAPYLGVTQVNGINRLEVRQLDPNGSGVFIYRKTIETHTAAIEGEYVQVTKIPLRPTDGSKWYEDRNPGLRPVIYRAIAYNRSDIKSHEFASVVVTPEQKMGSIKIGRQKRRLFISANAKVLEKTVQIELNDIPPGVLSLRVYRRDMTRLEKLSEATQVGNTIFFQKLPEPETRIYVTDTTPVEQRIFEYNVLLIFKDGTEYWATNPVTIQYKPVLNNVITTTVSPIKGLNVGSELDVQFNISSVIAEGKIDQIRNAMEQQGILGFYQDDITQNRDKLQNLIAYHIKRTNLTTSEIEDMGVFIGKEFSDKKIGRNKGVQPVRNGCVYEYTINTHFRSAQSLLTTFTREVTNPDNSNHDYTYAPSKWEHPVTLTDGNLVTPTTLRRNHAENEFTFGTVGDIVHTRISLEAEKPSAQNPSATPLGGGKVMIQWGLKGNPKQIDHFIVTREEMGMRTVVGKVHALTDANTLRFIDHPTIPEVRNANPSVSPPVKTGIVDEIESAATYHITPVLHNYSIGTVAKSPQAIIRKLR